MLTCNLISERYNQLRKEQFGITPCYTTLYAMFNQQLGLYLGCTGVVICYEEETCEGTSTTTCSLTSTQNIDSISCGLTATQN